MNYFIFDCETDGLYGKTLSIAAVVFDSEFAPVQRFDGSLLINACDLESDWVKENVYPHLSLSERRFDTEEALLEAFWAFYTEHRGTALCIADVPVPVEAGVLRKCVLKNEAERAFLAPYPLIDAASLLFAAGIDPSTDRSTLTDRELDRHRAYDDVLAIGDILSGLKKIGKLPL